MYLGHWEKLIVVIFCIIEAIAKCKTVRKLRSFAKLAAKTTKTKKTKEENFKM